MAQIDVIRHVIRPHQPARGEDYDPTQDMLIVVHKNPDDPDDPTEFGHHIRLAGLAYRKEMWEVDDYAETIDLELRDLERHYDREPNNEDYGVHPLASITEHYFSAPPERMKSFAPGYVLDRVESQMTALPHTTDAAVRMCLDVVDQGIDDVKRCLGSIEKHTFRCRGMTNLSSDTVAERTDSSTRMESQTQRLTLVSSKPLDTVRQLLVDRERELEVARDGFVNHALMQTNVPEIMRKRVISAAIQRGTLKEGAWM